MSKERLRLLRVLVLVSMLLPAWAMNAWAQSKSVGTPSPIRESALRMPLDSQSFAWHRPRRVRPCTRRRLLTGAAIGSIVAMVAVRRVAEENGGSIDAKGTLGVGGVGAAMGAVIALGTCK